MLARRRNVKSFTPLAGAGRRVDVAQAGAEFLHHFEFGRSGEIAGTDPERLHHQRDAVFQVGPHLIFGRHHPDFSRVESLRTLPHPRAPSGEIRLVGGHEIGEGSAALLACVRIEHERNEPRERIVLDDDDGEGGHQVLQLFFGSRSTLSAVNTRLCII